MKNPKVLKRPRVNHALETIFEFPLTIVEAPIGYGKTTAVREFLSGSDGPVLWLTCVSEENKLIYFWDAFSEEIGRVDRVAGERLKNLGFPNDAPEMANILSILGDIEFEKDTAFVLDDFHNIRSPQIGTFLKRAIIAALENLHIVVVTRDTTNLEIAELFAKGLCNLVPQRSLRFTNAEIRDYYALKRFSPPESVIKEIAEYTDGWISLVYLVMLGMEQGIPVGRSSAIDELIEKVLYNVYDERIRRFLLKLSVLNSFTAKQARFVTEEGNAQELLKKLRRENAFISYEETTGVYKIHNMLLDFLRAKYEDDEEFTISNLRAGEWFLTQKDYLSAYVHLCRAGETERVIALLDNEDTILNSAEFEGVSELFATTPRKLLFKYPLAYLQFIVILLVSGDPEATMDGVARLDELEAVFKEIDTIRPTRKNRVLAEINIVRVMAVFNDIEKMKACTSEATRLLEGGQCRMVRKEGEFSFGSPHFLYSYYKEPGKLKQTAEFIASEFPAFSNIANGCGTGCGFVALAEYALETGDWQGAELNALKAVYKAKHKEQASIVICAGFTLTRLYILQGKITEALEHLRQTEEDVAKENNSIYNTTLELMNGYVYACLGKLDSIPEWLRIGDMSLARFMYQGLAFNYIVYGKVLLLSKNYIQLEALIEVFEQYFSIFQNRLGFLHNKIFEAAVKNRLYGIEAGCLLLQEAFDMAREDNIILPFAENALDILDMVQHINFSRSGDVYLSEVLFCCKQYAEALKRAPGAHLNTLSPREIEILALAAEGLTRGEIAQRFYLSASTVQTHLHNIYIKMEVRGKTEAIKKAQDLKIL